MPLALTAFSLVLAASVAAAIGVALGLFILSRARDRGTSRARVEPPIDWLESDIAGDPEMASLVRLFVADLAEDVERMRAALDGGDLDALRRIVHNLKGSAGSYGFPSITERASRLEASLRAGHAGLRSEVTGFVELCARVRAVERGPSAERV